MALAQLRARHKWFNRMLKVSITLTYLVILAGSVVRNTGAGMGCPDWPRCFGQWVPPTCACQLPGGYEQEHIEHRKEKNQRYADLLDRLGYSDVALHLRTDADMYRPTPFNAVHTWTEYVNRLVGALLGLSLLISLVLSLPYLGTRTMIPVRMLAIVLLTGFQGWFGSIVVSTHLLPGTITVHMVLALLILALLIVLYVETSPGKRVNATFRMGNTMRYALTALLILSLVQVFLGTQVRQQIDVLTNTLGRDQRGLWIESLNWIFKVHRSFSIILLLLTGWIFYQVNRYMSHYWVVYRMTWFLAIFIGIETLTGVIMAYLGMPWWAQPVHMLVSSMIIGSLVYLLSSVHSKREIGAA